MKRLFRKNQMIITGLALMIAVAGYLNYTGRIFGDKNKEAKTSAEMSNKDLLDISEEDAATAGDITTPDGGLAENDVEGTPGEAVLTNGDATGVVAEAKVTREQVRAKNKETLLEIIDNDQISEAEKQDAIAQMIKMTDATEKEAAAETLMAAKGFVDAVVSMNAEGVDVVVDSQELSDASRAQIEDIITRKTGVAPEYIVITPINSGQDKAGDKADDKADEKPKEKTDEKAK